MNKQMTQKHVAAKGFAAIAAAGFLTLLLGVFGLGAAQPAWAQSGQIAAATPQLQDSDLQAQATPARGQTFVKNGNTYKVTDLADEDDLGEVTLVKYGSTNLKPTVNTVKYQGQVYEVDAIGKNAFNNVKGHKVTLVTLGRNVDRIGAKAFYGCKKLKTINMAKCDVIDIDYGANGYYLDETDIGAKAFKNAGVKAVKVKCGKSNASYQKVFKKALVSKGMRTSVTVVK